MNSMRSRCVVCLFSYLLGSSAAAAADPTKVGERWALLIGVDDYATAQDLSYCGADQRDLRNKLLGCGFADDHIFLMHDQAEDNKYRPARGNIERELGVVLNLAEENDLVIVGFSGHGVSWAGRSYLCPSDAVLDDSSSLVSLDTVYDRLNNCSAKFKLMLVDACRNDPHVGGGRSLTVTEGTKQLARSLQEIKLPEGVVLMNSCAPGEISWEEREFGHGVYMHHILEALSGAGDVDGDGALSINELQTFASTKTKTYVARRFSASQRPFFKLEGEGDLIQFALLPVPTGARPAPGAVVGGAGGSRFPARPEVKPNVPWIGDSRFMRNGRANVLIGVLKGGAADRAGLRANDVLISANGNRINKNAEIYDALAGTKPGDAVDFEITRDGKAMVVRVTLDPMPPDGGTGVITAAAEAGEVWAMAELAMRYSGMLRQLSFVDEDQDESLRWIQKAVDAGSSIGLLLLANRHYAGQGGPQNVPEAARLFEQARLAALRGPDRWVADEVSVVLGEIYFKGNGVPKDRTKSLDYFRAAADAGHVRAMNFLGTMYENGEVVNKDLGKALELYQVAAEGGNSDAQYNIGIMIYNGVLSTKDLTQARRWIEIAAENGNVNAMFALGVMMENGEGGLRNLAGAAAWFRKASDLGHPGAKQKIR